jgi:hypothetical protein
MRQRLPVTLSLAALVLAILGWTPVGESARNLVVPRGSVGTPQLKDGAVTAPKLRKEAVTSLKVRDGSLLTVDFKAGQLPAGPKGDKGDRGDPGPKGDRGPSGTPGLSGYLVVESEPVNLPANGFAIARATCPTGQKPIGGGGHVAGAVQGSGVLSSSIPIDQTQWQAAFKSIVGSAATIWAYAICATVQQ